MSPADFFLRTHLIKILAQVFSYRSYLEIGVSSPLRNFDKIDIADKTGVDPKPKRADIAGMSSDDFFVSIPETRKYDLIFIDGLHHCDQVLKDIENSLAHLSPGGTIVCHDMLPTNEKMQNVPQEVSEWTGDCWKAWAYLRMTRPDLKMEVLDTDHGLGIISLGQQRIFKKKLAMNDMTYGFYVDNRTSLMNIVELMTYLQDLGVVDEEKLKKVNEDISK